MYGLSAEEVRVLSEMNRTMPSDIKVSSKGSAVGCQMLLSDPQAPSPLQYFVVYLLSNLK